MHARPWEATRIYNPCQVHMELRIKKIFTKSKSHAINFGWFSQAILPTWLLEPVAMGLWGRVVTYDMLKQ